MWTQKGLDLDGEAAGDWSGLYTAVSGNGNIVATGAHHNDGKNVMSESLCTSGRNGFKEVKIWMGRLHMMLVVQWPYLAMVILLP